MEMTLLADGAEQLAGVLAQATNGTEIEDWEDIPWWVSVAAGAFAVGMWVFLFIQMRRGWRLKDVPISHTAGAFVGVGRFEGTTYSERPLVAPFVGEQCIWYQGEVKRSEQRQRTDSKGNTRTTTRWVTVWKSSGRIPFLVTDESGSLWVIPHEAHTNGNNKSGDYRRMPAPHTAPRIGRQWMRGSFGGGSRRGGRMGRAYRRNLRWSVEWLPTGEKTTVLGPVRWTADGPMAFMATEKGAARIGLPEPQSMGPDKAPFDIILGDDKGARRRNMKRTLLPLFLAPILTVLAGTLAGASLLEWEPVTSAVLSAGVVVLVALVALVIGGMNRAVRVRKRVDAGAAEIDVQLQRRADLLAQSVDLVKGYATFEADTFEKIAWQRSAKGETQVAEQVEGAQGQVRGQLLALSEQYPDLKANDSFMRLQQTITDCENRLALARGYYNDAVEAMANLRGQVPWGLFARLAGTSAPPPLQFADVRYQPPPSVADALRSQALNESAADDPTADDEGRVMAEPDDEVLGDDEDGDDEGADDVGNG